MAVSPRVLTIDLHHVAVSITVIEELRLVMLILYTLWTLYGLIISDAKTIVYNIAAICIQIFHSVLAIRELAHEWLIGDVALSVITIGIVSVSRQAILFIIRNGNAILANHVPCVYVVCVRFAYRMGAHTVHGKHMTIVIIRMGGGSNAVLLFLRTSPIVLFGQSPQKFMIQRV